MNTSKCQRRNSLNFRNIIYEKKEGVATITINRPDVLNALNPNVMLELRTAFDEARKDSEVKVVVITGAGDRAFSAGADISALMNLSMFDARELSREGQKILAEIENLEKPVIAAVNGLALGGGCEIAMACDIRIASENAKFGQPEIKLGVIPGYGGTQRLSRLIGMGKAKELIFTGDMINAKEAERVGLVNKVVPAGKLQAAVKEIADKIISKSPVAIRMVKAAMNKGAETDLDTGMVYESELFGMLFSTEDQKEGMKAFLEKRKPEFKGK